MRKLRASIGLFAVEDPWHAWKVHARGTVRRFRKLMIAVGWSAAAHVESTHALGATPGGCRGVEPTTEIPNPHRGRAHAGLPLRPTSPLPRAAQQARADRRGPGGSFASLLFMRALRRRPIARRCRTGCREYGILSRGAPHAGDRRPGGALRSWPRTDESSGRPGGDYQIRGA